MIEKFRKEIDLVDQGEIARPLHADALLKVYVAAIRNGAAPAARWTHRCTLTAAQARNAARAQSRTVYASHT